MQNNIYRVLLHQIFLTCNFVSLHPLTILKHRLLAIVIEKILALHQSHSVYKSFEIIIMHHTALQASESC